MQYANASLTVLAASSLTAASSSPFGLALLHTLLTLQRPALPTSPAAAALQRSALEATLSSISPSEPVTVEPAINALLTACNLACRELLEHHEMFSNLLKRLEHLDVSHTHLVAKLFARLIVEEGAPVEVEAVVDSSGGLGDFPLTAALEDRYSSMLEAADVSQKQAAIVGVLHWAFALAQRGPDSASAARVKLEALQGRLQKHMGLQAYLLDVFSDMLQQAKSQNVLTDPVRSSTL